MLTLVRGSIWLWDSCKPSGSTYGYGIQTGKKGAMAIRNSANMFGIEPVRVHAALDNHHLQRQDRHPSVLLAPYPAAESHRVPEVHPRICSFLDSFALCQLNRLRRAVPTHFEFLGTQLRIRAMPQQDLVLLRLSFSQLCVEYWAFGAALAGGLVLANFKKTDSCLGISVHVRNIVSTRSSSLEAPV